MIALNTAARDEFRLFINMPITKLTGGESAFGREIPRSAELLENMVQRDASIDNLGAACNCSPVAVIVHDLRELATALNAIATESRLPFPHTKELDKAFQNGIVAMRQSATLGNALLRLPANSGMESIAGKLMHETNDMADRLQKLVDKHFPPLSNRHGQEQDGKPYTGRA